MGELDGPLPPVGQRESLMSLISLFAGLLGAIATRFDIGPLDTTLSEL